MWRTCRRHALAVAPRSRDLDQATSKIALAITIPRRVAIDAGSLMSVVNTNVTSVMPVVATAASRITRFAPVSRPDRGDGRSVTSPKIISATALPIDAIADRSKKSDHHDDGHSDDKSPIGTAADASGHDRRELAGRREMLDQAGCRIQPGVRRAGRREQRGDAHQPVAQRRRGRVGRPPRSRSALPR